MFDCSWTSKKKRDVSRSSSLKYDSNRKSLFELLKTERIVHPHPESTQDHLLEKPILIQRNPIFVKKLSQALREILEEGTDRTMYWKEPHRDGVESVVDCFLTFTEQFHVSLDASSPVVYVFQIKSLNFTKSQFNFKYRETKHFAPTSQFVCNSIQKDKTKRHEKREVRMVILEMFQESIHWIDYMRALKWAE